MKAPTRHIIRSNASFSFMVHEIFFKTIKAPLLSGGVPIEGPAPLPLYATYEPFS
jgi:hypothetical protein